MQTNSPAIQSARTQLLDCLWNIQHQHGYIRDEDMRQCAQQFEISEIELEGVISFYTFFHRKPAGKYTIYLNDSIIAELKGFQRVKEAFERETGAAFGTVDPTGQFGLFETPCIGLSDREPAALINFHPFTNLNTLKVRKIITELKKGRPVEELCDTITEHIRYVPEGKRAIFFREYLPGAALSKLTRMSPEETIEEVNRSKLSGRGGAFFPTGLKWSLCRQQKDGPKYIVGNADEGEPGTFKDRALMNAMPGLVLEGMAVAAYAVGAEYGVLYLRAEYTWLKDRLEKEIAHFRRMGLLGKDIMGIKGFDFDIRLQLGAGSYVVGEETAMLNSMEGKRGEARVKQYYPIERGFLGKPTVVNNVETLCAAARVIELGARHFLSTGTPESPGTKIISVCGDCHLPGIYEIEWGMTVGELLRRSQADAPYFIQLSGPSGDCISVEDKGQQLSKDGLACGGAFMIFNRQRDILDILINFADFFKEESCGVCTPCRAGNFIIRRKLEKIKTGLAQQQDFDDIRQWGGVMRRASRCGLGKMATQSLIKALDTFPEYFNKKLGDGLNESFDLEKLTEEYEKFRS